MLSTTDLIVAAATREGFGARGIIRMAGDGLERILGGLFDADSPGFPTSGVKPRVVRGRLASSGLGRTWGALPVDVLSWPGPGGPIGGPLAELQLPACGPLVADVLAEACRLGCREARGGEFTLRAFLSGRIDLVQAEAVVGITDSRSPAELSAALDRMAGGAGQALAAVRDDLLDLLADIEAAIDFADDSMPDSVPAGPDWRRVADRIRGCEAMVATVAAHLGARDAAAAELPMVVFSGPPNIGKSSLLNALVGREAALVADERGTTRDWIEARLCDATGPRCLLVDVAGVDESDLALPIDAIAADATARARDAIARADVVIACRDSTTSSGTSEAPHGAIAVITRCDLTQATLSGDAIATSSLHRTGVAELKAAILEAVARLTHRGSPATLRLAIGCQAALASLAEAVHAVQAAVAGHFYDESLVASHLRRAADSLADVTGATVDTDLLDRIFARHCIGK
jgi:tRNA modification GTPase